MSIQNKIVYSLLGLMVVGLTACSHKQEPKERSDKFVVTDTLLNSLLTDTVRDADAKAELTLTGSVAPDETKMTRIFPMVSGITKSVNVQLGDHVRKGQVLAVLQSAEIAGFTRDYIAAEADARTAKRALETAQDMYKSGLSSEKDLEAAKADYQKALAESKRAGSVISLNKASGQGYTITAPIDGFVIEKNVTNNMQVRDDNSQNMFTIADLSSVYVMINMYESDIAGVQEGDPVKISTLAYPGKVFSGKIDKLMDMLDPENKVMRARVRIDNPGYLLKPEMFADVRIQAKSGYSLPGVTANAIIFDNNKNYVVVIDGPAKVHIQEVEIAKRVEDIVYVSKGLQPGERVVASRQLFLFESLKD